MHKKISVGLALAIALLCVAVTVGIAVPVTLESVNQKVGGIAQRNALVDKLEEIDLKTRSNYLGELDEKALGDGIAAGYMGSLGDDYAQYYSAEEYQQKQDASNGKTAGAGLDVTLHPDSGEIYIYHVESNGPGAKAGFQKGDLIVTVNDTSVVSSGYDAAVEEFQGISGTKVKTQIRRGDALLELTVTLGDYEQDSVTYRAIGSLGYIAIRAFNNTTKNQFSTALTALQKENVTGLIFDLRNNLGGDVTATAEVLDLLLPSGDTILSKEKNGDIKVLYSSDEKEVSLPMAVLVNGKTASASEIFADALRAFNKAKLYGENTYGKGVMQVIYPLSDGSAVKMTVAEYVSKSGVSYNGKGLTPDVPVSLTEEQQKYYYMLTDDQDPQLMAAIGALNR